MHECSPVHSGIQLDLQQNGTSTCCHTPISAFGEHTFGASKVPSAASTCALGWMKCGARTSRWCEPHISSSYVHPESAQMARPDDLSCLYLHVAHRQNRQDIGTSHLMRLPEFGAHRM
jgi:hypothetical protein